MQEPEKSKVPDSDESVKPADDNSDKSLNVPPASVGGGDHDGKISRENQTKKNEGFCHKTFLSGECTCDDQCKYSHDFDFEKLRKGVCRYEFKRKRSCRLKKECPLSHEIPSSYRNNTGVEENLGDRLAKPVGPLKKTTIAHEQESGSNHSNTALDDVCINEFYGGSKSSCIADQCPAIHNLDHRKISKGICFYEFFDVGSCPYSRGKCRFTHEIPIACRYDEKVVEMCIRNINRSKNRLEIMAKLGIDNTPNLNDSVSQQGGCNLQGSLSVVPPYVASAGSGMVNPGNAECAQYTNTPCSSHQNLYSPTREAGPKLNNNMMNTRSIYEANPANIMKTVGISTTKLNDSAVQQVQQVRSSPSSTAFSPINSAPPIEVCPPLRNHTMRANSPSFVPNTYRSLSHEAVPRMNNNMINQPMHETTPRMNNNIIMNTLNHPSTQNFLIHIMKEMLSKEMSTMVQTSHTGLPVGGRDDGFQSNFQFTM